MEMTPVKHLLSNLEGHHWFIGTAAACCLYRHHMVPETDTGAPQQAYVQVALLIVAVGLSLLAGYLLAKKNRDIVPDDKPTPLAQKGSYTWWVTGIMRIGFVFAWAGERFTVKERQSGGKGGLFAGPKIDIWKETGWHQLCPGPIDALHQIRESGKVIFQGPITPGSHPSGSTIDLGDQGVFEIYWGEPTQPQNTYLGDASRLSVSSRWPYMCYIQWRGKRLGQQPQWQVMDYVVERRPTGNHLTQSTPWIDATRTLDGSSHGTVEVTNGVEGVGHWIVELFHGAAFHTQAVFFSTGNGVPNGDFTVFKSEEFIFELVAPDPINGIKGVYIQRTRIFPVGGLTGATSGGSLQLYTTLPDDGANIAHCWADLLFEPWPIGLNLDKSDWNMDSLEDIGVLTSQQPGKEDLRCYLASEQGATALATLGSSMQDIGVLAPIDVADGRIKFIELRDAPAAGLPRIRETVFSKRRPETRVRHLEAPVDEIVFAFNDRLHNFRKTTLGKKSSGSIVYRDVARARTVPIVSTNVVGTASSILERRAQEELSGAQATTTIETTRGTRELLPGQSVVVDLMPEVQRILETQVQDDSGCVSLQVVPDFMGAANTNFVFPSSPLTQGLKNVAVDPQFALAEVPEALLQGSPPTVIMPRIRAHTQISSALIHVSGDNITYINQGEVFDVQSGGTLVDALPLHRPAMMGLTAGTGPLVDLAGPIEDAQALPDLTTDEFSWLAGRMLALIGTEIFYVRRFNVISPTQARLDGLVSTRYDVPKQAHAAGDKVFVFLNDSPLAIQDAVLLQPNRPLYGKSQPLGNGQVPLAQIPPDSILVYGKGIRPPTVAFLHVAAPFNLVNAYQTGDDVRVAWSYAAPRSPGTGAGFFGAGTAVTQEPPSEGDWKVEVLDAPGTTVVRTVTVGGAGASEYTYQNASLVADLGGETNFFFRVTQIRDGLESDPVTLAVTKI